MTAKQKDSKKAWVVVNNKTGEWIDVAFKWESCSRFIDTVKAYEDLGHPSKHYASKDLIIRCLKVFDPHTAKKRERPRYVQKLIPIRLSGPSDRIHALLVRFICEQILPSYREKSLDIRLTMFMVHLVIAFANYDRTGDVSAFEKELFPCSSPPAKKSAASARRARSAKGTTKSSRRS